MKVHHPKPVLYFLLTIAFSISGCHFNSSRINDPKDKGEAEWQVMEFYKHVKAKEYEKTLPLLSRQFLQKSDTGTYLNFLRKYETELGPADSSVLVNYKTEVVNGDQPKATYVLVFKSFRPRGTFQETFSLIKEKEEVKIIAYNINLLNQAPAPDKPEGR
jgi:hypothetical protein